MPHLSCKDRTIYFEWLNERQHADDKTLVLINGIFSDSRNFGEIYQDLIRKSKNHFGIIAIDNSNLGRSTYIGKAIPLVDQVEELAWVVDQEAIKNPIWIANSSVAGIACLAAATINSAGLILGSPVLSCGMETRLKYFRSIMAKTLEDQTFKNMCEMMCFLILGSSFLNANPHFMISLNLKVKSLYSHKDFLVLWEQTNGPEHDSEETILNLNCPTLVIRGREEMMQPLHILQALFSRENCKITTLPSGHFVLFEAREQTTEIIFDFINSLTTMSPHYELI